LRGTWSLTLWEKVGANVYMPATEDGVGFIMFARDDVSGGVVGRKAAASTSVAKFIQDKDVPSIVLHGGSENLDLTKDLLNHYTIKRAMYPHIILNGIALSKEVLLLWLINCPTIAARSRRIGLNIDELPLIE